jgi:peptidoglycan/LPS O-acetylase OafA/YrhL
LYLLIIGIQFGLHAFGYVTEDYAVVPGKILLTHLFFAQEYIPLSSSWSINFVMGSWTLFIEAIWYVLMAGLFLFKVPHQRVMWISIAGFAVIILTSYFLNIRFPLGRMGMLFNCILGLHLYRWSKKEISDAAFLTTLLPSLFLIFCGLGLAYWHFTSEHFTVNCVLASWSGAYLLFGLFYFLHNTGVAFLDSFLHFLGKISYSVYLAHFSVLILVEHYFGLTALAFGLTVSVTLLFSTGSYRWIEKPGIDLGKRLVK